MLYGTILICALALQINFAQSAELSVNDTYTPPTFSEPETFVSAPEIHLAATWFLPDYQNGSIRYSSRTEKEPYPYEPSCGIEYKYTDENCKIPQYVSGQPCMGRYPECKTDTARACTGYVKNCSSGWQLSANNRCPYDENYGTCCNQCQGFDYAEVPQGYSELSRCESCNGLRYQIKVNPCDGYTDCRYGAAPGAKICYSGDTPKYNSCKSCANECTLAACPKGSDCTYESCSGKYCAIGCAVNYQPKDSLWCDGSISCWISLDAEQTCVALPSCEELGFTKNLKDCWCKTYLHCPFDLTKLYCSD